MIASQVCSRSYKINGPAQDRHRIAKAVASHHHPRQHKHTRLFAACKDCITGSLDDGTPKGKETTLAGVPCYVSNPSVANGCAVILSTDIFGYQLVNSRLIADIFAENGYTCVVPDYFEGEPMNLQLLEVAESLPERSLFGKVAGFTQLAGQIVGMGSWFSRHPVQHAVDVVTAVAKELRNKNGISKIGLQGYCYGGKVGVRMAAQPDCVDAVCSAHPGLIKVPDDIQAVKVPLLFICAESDAQFPEKTRTAAEKLLQQKQPGLGTFILYPGTKHGFAVRGDKRNPTVNAAREDALKQGLRFFNQHLGGGKSIATVAASVTALW